VSDFLIKEGVVSTMREFDELINQNQFANLVLRVDSATHCRSEDRLCSNIMESLQVCPIVDSLGWHAVLHPMPWKESDRTTVPVAPSEVHQAVSGINLLRLSLLDTREVVEAASSDQTKHALKGTGQ